jgi:hypothetical protein
MGHVAYLRTRHALTWCRKRGFDPIRGGFWHQPKWSTFCDRARESGRREVHLVGLARAMRRPLVRECDVVRPIAPAAVSSRRQFQKRGGICSEEGRGMSRERVK